mmetsp:Transcript_19527/g.20940  ORF Transcript_19527/g.20940 Transcript_19527/m.20940 type:complete len:93 (+) Transcript_19527:133-411(+)
MSQTNTNNGNGDTNQYHNTGRDGQSQGGSCGQCPGNRNGNRGNNSIANYSFEGKLKDRCLSNLKITKSGHRATQFKKILDTFPGLCEDKNDK